MNRTLFAALLLLAPACSRGELAAPSELASLEQSVGMLQIDPTADRRIKGGTVQYRIYENGDIRYQGDVRYVPPGARGLELSLPFTGETKFAAATVLSASYRAEGSYLREKKVGITVDEASDTSAKVKLSIADRRKVDSTDMTGSMLLRTAGPVASIQQVDVTGTIFQDTPAEVKIRVVMHAP